MSGCRGCSGTCCTGVGSDPCVCLPPEETDDEPKRYAWEIPGFGVKAGTLKDYARDMQHAHYSGDEPPSSLVWLGGRKFEPVSVINTGTDGDDYLHFMVACGGDTAFYQIDGRS